MLELLAFGLAAVAVIVVRAGSSHREGHAVNCGVTVDRRSDRPGYRATLAGFWPHNGAQRCRLLRIAEQHSSRSTDVWPGSRCIRNSLRICECCSGGSGWTAARIGSGAPGDSLRIWPLCACPSSDLSPGRRHRPGPPRWPDQKPVRRWRDPSQMCRSMTPPRPVPTSAPPLKGDTRPHDHAGRGRRGRHRDRHPPR